MVVNYIQKAYLAFLLPKLYNTSILFTSLYLVQRQKRSYLRWQQHHLITIGILIGFGLQFTTALLLGSNLFAKWLMRNKSILQLINSSILFIGLTWLGLSIVRRNSNNNEKLAQQQIQQVDFEEEEKPFVYPNSGSTSSSNIKHMQTIYRVTREPSALTWKSVQFLKLLVPSFFIFYQAIEDSMLYHKTSALYVLLMFTILKRYATRYSQQIISLMIIHFTSAIQLSKIFDYSRKLFVAKPELAQSLVHTIRQSQQQSWSLLSQIWSILFTNDEPSLSNATLSGKDAAIWTGTGYSVYWFFISSWLVYHKLKSNK
ncbi:hypothetical protein BDF20DRAFT_838439 [Mycotypha africana]|uniref:uncharacterized protein n=1 Tax=Mycotypha africana TaxID=64632 RepID=UPI002301971C|nr:uncharacterized protein BDF20DRAFT_838439 [Mycotypha africana]KAI8970039.1 hypothetical protein BDF20DRAFT_838439 [Mycotypha africana]